MQETWVQPLGREGPLEEYSWLETSMDRKAWRATVHEIAESWTQLSDQHFHDFHHILYTYFLH